MLESKFPPAPWARIHVVRGAAPRGLLLQPDQPLLLIVGSDPDAQLSIPCPSVAPRQLDVLWDGASLWLEDKLRLGRTFVNGRLLNEWVRVRGEVIVSFGSLRLWIAAGGGGKAAPPTGPDFEAVERASQVPEHDSASSGRADRRSQTGRFCIPAELAHALSAADDLSA
jgi:hypothetical protein